MVDFFDLAATISLNLLPTFVLVWTIAQAVKKNIETVKYGLLLCVVFFGISAFLQIFMFSNIFLWFVPGSWSNPIIPA